MPKPRPSPISLADAQRAARKALRQIIARDRKMTTFPAEFLNVDLDIKSKVGLGMLLRRGTAMHCSAWTSGVAGTGCE